MTETTGLVSLFLSSFLGATLLPGGSEAVLFIVLKSYPESTWSAVGIATLGNTAGGMVSFFMGWWLPQHKGSGKTDEHKPAPPLRATRPLKHVDKLRRFGTPALLLAWMPLIGDALCLAAGWLRLNPWQVLLFMTIGKFSRYMAIALL